MKQAGLIKWINCLGTPDLLIQLLTCFITESIIATGVNTDIGEYMDPTWRLHGLEQLQ